MLNRKDFVLNQTGWRLNNNAVTFLFSDQTASDGRINRDLVLGDIGLVIPHNLVCHFIISVDVEQGDGGPKNDLATGRNRSNIDDLCSR